MVRKTRQQVLLTLMLSICLLVVMNAKAQDGGPLRMGIGIDVGPTLKKTSRVTAGADLRLQKIFGQGISGILTTGYYQFFKINKNDEGFGIVPLKAGLKYFPAKNIYVAGEIGAGFGTKNGMGTSFVFSPSVGFAFGDGFDASLKYENYTKYDGYAQLLALRVAYGFKL